MSWRSTLLATLLFAGLLALLDVWLGPVATRITDRQTDDQTVRLVAVAPRWPDAASLLDFLDLMEEVYDDHPAVQLDIVQGRQRATLREMAADPKAWQQRVLVSFRRQGRHSTVVVSPRVLGELSR